MRCRAWLRLIPPFSGHGVDAGRSPGLRPGCTWLFLHLAPINLIAANLRPDTVVELGNVSAGLVPADCQPPPTSFIRFSYMSLPLDLSWRLQTLPTLILNQDYRDRRIEQVFLLCSSSQECLRRGSRLILLEAHPSTWLTCCRRSRRRTRSSCLSSIISRLNRSHH